MMRTFDVTQVSIAVITGIPSALKLYSLNPTDVNRWSVVAITKDGEGYKVSITEVTYAEVTRESQGFLVTFDPDVIARIFRGVTVPVDGMADDDLLEKIQEVKALQPGADYTGRFPRDW
jgi:hypothetical protein